MELKTRKIENKLQASAGMWNVSTLGRIKAQHTHTYSTRQLYRNTLLLPSHNPLIIVLYHVERVYKDLCHEAEEQARIEADQAKGMYSSALPAELQTHQRALREKEERERE